MRDIVLAQSRVFPEFRITESVGDGANAVI